MNSNMVKPGKCDGNIDLIFNITIYRTIFNLVINVLVGRCIQNSFLHE